MKRTCISLLLVMIASSSAYGEEPDYPWSDIITEVEWAPVDSIIRMGQGGDNWPATWGDDGKMYTAYGDGFGFIPQLADKLSLGFASVSGQPGALSAENIRSSDIEQYGSGRVGKKASGLLMVEGVLYMWVRNVESDGTGCQLATSSDRGLSWQWQEWSFSEFGYCTFLNFGRNYEGARDDYVYSYTPNGPSAYDTSDSMVLMRVPKGSITSRASFEFYAGTQADGTPIWTDDVTARQPVFEHAESCRRSGITYNAALGRYIWWQAITGGDTRRKGGFLLLEGPEPWGPWSLAYYTDDWDVGPGDVARFPTKWMSEDGLSMHLLFSGDDAFSVRQVLLNGGEGEPVDNTAPAPPTDLAVTYLP